MKSPCSRHDEGDMPAEAGADESVQICRDCGKGEFRGYPPVGSPPWAVGTIYFWCPLRMHHNQFYECNGCPGFEPGTPRKFDKHGREIS